MAYRLRRCAMMLFLHSIARSEQTVLAFRSCPEPRYVETRVSLWPAAKGAIGRRIHSKNCLSIANFFAPAYALHVHARERRRGNVRCGPCGRIKGRKHTMLKGALLVAAGTAIGFGANAVLAQSSAPY
jgi:hypothetical protein